MQSNETKPHITNNNNNNKNFPTGTVQKSPSALGADLGKFDLVYSIEVAEHMPLEMHTHVVQFFTALSRKGTKLIFSAATPGQAGTGHIGLRSVAEWKTLIEAGGFRKDEKETMYVKQTVETYNHKKNIQVFYFVGNADTEEQENIN